MPEKKPKALTPPKRLGGVEVVRVGTPSTVNGEIWHTYIPADEDLPHQVWEWSETTGRVIKTVEPDREVDE